MTANVNAAKNDIVTLEQALKDAENANNACNNEIFGLADTRAKIENAIADKQNKINDINDKINKALPVLGSLTAKLDSLIKQRTEAQNAVSPNAKKLEQL